MRVTGISLVLLVVGGLCAGAAAQAGPAGAESVLEQIPAEAMGFVMVRNIRDLTDNVDKFIADIGLGEMVREEMPDGLLGLLKEEIELGEGFNPDGGVAVALMDFQQFGFDVEEFMSDEPSEEPPPFAIWVSAGSIEGLFRDFDTEPVGDYTAVVTPDVPLLAMQHGDYVVLSLRPDVLDAVKAGGPSAETVLNAREKEILNESDVAAYVNMRVAGPLLMKVMETFWDGFWEEAAMGPGGMFGPDTSADVTAEQMAWYRKHFDQMEGMLFAGRFVDEGLVVEQLVRYVPDSLMGRIVTSYQPVQTGLLDRLPDLPYVLAVGGRGRSDAPEAEREYMSDYLDMLTSMFGEEALSEQGRADLDRIVLGLNEQVTNFQFVGGGAPEGAGIFALGAVMECEDADTTARLVRDGIGYVENLIKHVAPPGEAEDLEIKYAVAAETIGGVSVDIMEITDPGLEDMPDYEKEQMAAVLGEAKVQFRMARPDDRTVVVTFGGAGAFMEEALKLVDGGGPIPDQAGTQLAMKYMPEGSSMLVLFNTKNLFTALERGAETLMGPGMMPPMDFQADTPLAAGAATDGSSIRTTVFVPADVLQDFVGMAMMWFAPAPAYHDPFHGPMEGAEDF